MNCRTIIQRIGLFIGAVLTLGFVFEVGRAVGYTQASKIEAKSTANADAPAESEVEEPIEISFDNDNA